MDKGRVQSAIRAATVTAKVRRDLIVGWRKQPVEVIFHILLVAAPPIGKITGAGLSLFAR